MAHSLLQQRIVDVFDSLPPKLKTAARWMLDHADDIALLSLREQARRAGVTPATLSRLAQRLGFAGFDDVRQVQAKELRKRPDLFRNRAAGLLMRQAVVADMLAGTSAQLDVLRHPELEATLGRVADLLLTKKRIFCLGMRSSFAAMHLFAYLLSVIGEKAILVENAGGLGLDGLRDLGADDAVLALTIRPYARQTVDAVGYALSRGASVVALTDSPVSPVAGRAAELIVVPTETPSFMQTMVPALIVVECLAALMAAKRGDAALTAIAEAEDYLEHFDIYISEGKRKTPIQE